MSAGSEPTAVVGSDGQVTSSTGYVMVASREFMERQVLLPGERLDLPTCTDTDGREWVVLGPAPAPTGETEP